MLRETLLFSFLFGGALTANSANQYVDNVLQSSLRQELVSAKLLPAQLPDFIAVVGSTKKSRAEVDFTFGNITGLDRITRKGDCSGPKNYGGEISINCTLSLHTLKSAHKVIIINATSVNVSKVQASISEVHVGLQIVGRPQNYLGLLAKFDVGSLHLLTPVFSDIPAYIKDQVPYLQKVYRSHVEDSLSSLFTRRYADAVRRAFAFKPMPRQ